MSGELDLTGFADSVGTEGPVTIAGLSTRGGAVAGVRSVTAPSGIVEFTPDEMTIRCGAGTPMTELDEALSGAGQTVAIPPAGTVGGALATGRSGLRRLGYGPVRDSLLQARYVNANGEVVKAGGPTVKNVSGFDLCRLLVGSFGTLGFVGEVILRTRPVAAYEQWFTSTTPPERLLRDLYRPTSILWDGDTSWILLDGHRHDVLDQADAFGLLPADPPVDIPSRGRWSVPPNELKTLVGSGRFLAEIGVGIVHHELPAPARDVDPVVVGLHRRIKTRFDPTGRLNPGVDVLAAA